MLPKYEQIKQDLLREIKIIPLFTVINFILKPILNENMLLVLSQLSKH